jgi:hypothetical protein
MYCSTGAKRQETHRCPPDNPRTRRWTADRRFRVSHRQFLALRLVGLGYRQRPIPGFRGAFRGSHRHGTRTRSVNVRSCCRADSI